MVNEVNCGQQTAAVLYHFPRMTVSIVFCMVTSVESFSLTPISHGWQPVAIRAIGSAVVTKVISVTHFASLTNELQWKLPKFVMLSTFNFQFFIFGIKQDTSLLLYPGSQTIKPSKMEVSSQHCACLSASLCAHLYSVYFSFDDPMDSYSYDNITV